MCQCWGKRAVSFSKCEWDPVYPGIRPSLIQGSSLSTLPTASLASFSHLGARALEVLQKPHLICPCICHSLNTEVPILPYCLTRSHFSSKIQYWVFPLGPQNCPLTFPLLIPALSLSWKGRSRYPTTACPSAFTHAHELDRASQGVYLPLL